MLFVICSTLAIFAQLSSSFKVELENVSLFHIETEQKLCGCEERSNLEELKNKEWTPEDFMTDHGKMWLGSTRSDQDQKCAKLCLLSNRRTSHFTFERGMNIFSKCVFPFRQNIVYFIYNGIPNVILF